ncbi:hypothetical protein dqs_3614 [Azoarcus olearius]|uniref:T6SS effector phospholipase Tle3 domain-containing protein n=1 Tax=Azoarcus sp. (strain BH72) TaxID=418699 RepID=UPI0008064111|nr:hypothetical protein [Azoarcus olearius]ANQ86631.1 hypothetical protein dqs_3614 [Azoarcus olearius]
MNTSDFIAVREAVLQPDKGTATCVAQLPLPGVIILVHGVNSDGEWYEATEQGLCAGLNTRLGRRDEDLAIKGVAGGQMVPTTYAPEIDENGFLDRRRSSKTFITAQPNHSPVIRFRWGYKANKDELAEYGSGIWLNEHNYWGGGPFANGCTSLGDLWGAGVNDRLFLWFTVQHLNPETGRQVYACPPRHYYAFAALRLAELVRSIRQKQADVPITIVCHSQGNMVGLAAAFYGARIGTVTDSEGKSAPAIADNYVLANAPYSLVEKGMGTDDWAQRYSVNSKGQWGRQTRNAREQTLANFFALIRSRIGSDQPEDEVQRVCGNGEAYDVATDRSLRCRNGRVTVYCNPHDRVISSLTVQGIGWRGMNAEDFETTQAHGVLFQRVWAQGNPVGASADGEYRYWDGESAFWHPPPRKARYSLKQGVEAGASIIGKVMTVVSTPLIWLIVLAVRAFDKSPRVNAMPDPEWRVPVNAPVLPEPHLPQGSRLGQPTAFDQDDDPDHDRLRPRLNDGGSEPDDSYQAYRRDATEVTEAAPQADADTEGRLKYEHRARLRMNDRRRGGDGEGANQAPGETTKRWDAWARKEIKSFLDQSLDQHATDHSTIMTCAANIEKVLAYDVTVGVSRLTQKDWKDLRIAADWQLQLGLSEDSAHAAFGLYFDKGVWNDNGVERHLHHHPDFNTHANPTAIPPGIVDERSRSPSPPNGYI